VGALPEGGGGGGGGSEEWKTDERRGRCDGTFCLFVSSLLRCLRAFYIHGTTNIQPIQVDYYNRE
jgi:hypothetical protein